MSVDQRGPKERVYDEEIAPLLRKAATLCHREDIGLVAKVYLDTIELPEDEFLVRSSSFVIPCTGPAAKRVLADTVAIDEGEAPATVTRRERL